MHTTTKIKMKVQDSFFFLFLIPTFINTKSVKTGVFTEPCVRQLKQY